MSFDVTTDLGINVGRNSREQTVAPGRTRRYRWFADQEGAFNLRDGADVLHHAAHGLIGALVVECAQCTVSNGLARRALNRLVLCEAICLGRTVGASRCAELVEGGTARFRGRHAAAGWVAAVHRR